MSQYTITVQKRAKNQCNESLRKQRLVPGVLYGGNINSESIVAQYEDLKKLLKKASMHNLIDLDLDLKKQKVLIKDFQTDPVKDTITHIDFYIVNEKKKVIVSVPIRFEGVSPAIRLGAFLTVAMPKIKIKCLPKDIPSDLVVDISGLKEAGDKIMVSELKKPKNIELMVMEKVMIVKVEFSRASKIEEESQETISETAKEEENKEDDENK